MDLGGATFLLGGSLACGVILGLLLSLMAWRTEPSYGKALRVGLTLGFAISLTLFVGLVVLGLYENWTRA